MIYLFLIGITLPALAFLGWEYYMGKERQKYLDASRKTYTVVYPRGTTEDGVQAWLNSIGSDLIPNASDNGAIPTIVAEVRWTDKGLRHVLRITPQDQSHVLSMLEAHLNGVTVDPIDTPEESLDIEPVFGVDVVMSDSQRMLRIKSIKDLATAILHSVPTIGEGEAVVYQVIASHTEHIKVPQEHTVKSRASWTDMLLSRAEAPKEEIVDRKQKVIEQNFNITLRISAQAANEIRGRELVGGVIRSLRSAESNYVSLSGSIIKHNLREIVNLALTPRKKTAQLTVTELSAFIAPPIGDPAVPGLSQGAARRIAPTEAVSRGGIVDGVLSGRLLGHSNIPGRERPVALDYEFVDRNSIFIGGIGSGKSVGMANNAEDDMRAGMGVFVIDASGSDSAQSLYSRVHDYIPDNRIDDVIDIHIRNNADFPVAFDLFKQGRGMGAIDQITSVFTGLYPDIDKGVSVRDLLYHGLWTLLESDLSLIDLAPLLRPKNASEMRWAMSIVTKMNNPELKDFWDRMKVTGFGNDKKRDSWDRYTDPLYRRLWQLVGRPEIRHMIGQTSTEGDGLNWQKAVAENKIVLISMSGLPAESAQALANLLTKSLWETAQTQTPEKPNALYMDEFQVSAGIKDVLEDMLARGRKHKLPVTLGTQYISGLPRDIQTAVLNNVMTRVIYPLSSSDEAALWRRNMATEKLADWDFQNGRRFEPIVQLPTPSGNQIVTIKALKERPKTGNSSRVAALSRQRYGKPIDAVRQEIQARRNARPTSEEVTSKAVGSSPYEFNEDDWK